MMRIKTVWVTVCDFPGCRSTLQNAEHMHHFMSCGHDACVRHSIMRTSPGNGAPSLQCGICAEKNRGVLSVQHQRKAIS